MMQIFQKAKMIFPKGKLQQPNTLACFRKDIVWKKSEKKVELLIAAHVFYRVYVNGAFVSVGPAPAPYGYLRSDRINITNFMSEGVNRFAIEIMGYVPVENNYATFENSCLCAEVLEDKQVLTFTNSDWSCGILNQKRCEVETLSFGRRIPLEWYDLDDEYITWRTGEIKNLYDCEEIDRECYVIERGVSLPDLTIYSNPILSMVTSLKETAYDGVIRSWWENDDYISRSGEERIGRPSVECESLQDIAFDGTIIRNVNTKSRLYTLTNYVKKAGLEFSFEKAETGFIGITFNSKKPVQIDILFNDYLTEEGRVPAKADSVNRVIRLQSKGGRYSFEAFECHYVKFVKIIITGGEEFTLEELYIRSYHYPDNYSADFRCNHDLMNRIYQGGKQTLLTNSLGFFLDSPGRERGGWAGDSYWTGRAAQVLISDTSLERAMLLNFLFAMPTKMMDNSFPSCCCGGDKQEEILMFTWNLFVLLELTDYYMRTADEELKDEFELRVRDWMQAAAYFENDIGLLENIPGSLFLDWSVANKKEYTEPISAPTNTLYAMVLKRLGQMYENEKFITKADRIYFILREHYNKSEDTKFDVFTMYPYMSDALCFQDGELLSKEVYSEAAQYYYLWTNMLNRKLAPNLVKRLLEEMGPSPDKFRGIAHLSVGNCGIFFGYMIRFEVLSMLGEYERLFQEINVLCGHMLKQEPGTFWESMNGEDSRNHGFGAHFSVVLVRDFLGLHIPDRTKKRVKVSPHPCELLWAKGGFDTVGGYVHVQWICKKDEFTLLVNVPKDYTAEITLPKEFMYYNTMEINGVECTVEQYKECIGSTTITMCLKS